MFSIIGLSALIGGGLYLRGFFAGIAGYEEE